MTLSDYVQVVEDYAPLVFYLGSMLVFYRIAHLRVTFPLWKLAWACMTLMASALASARLALLLINAYDLGDQAWWEVVRNSLVIGGSVAMFAAAALVWYVFHLGFERHSPLKTDT